MKYYRIKHCSILLKNKLDFAPRRTVNEDGDFGGNPNFDLQESLSKVLPYC